MRKILLLTLIIISINFVNADVICEYASNADSTSQNVRGSLAVYATGMPDARTSGECSSWSGYGHSWTPANWNFKANLTLRYEKGISVKNLSVIGDYDMCLSGIWLKNSSNGEIKKISNGNDNRCNAYYLLDDSFIGDIIILQSCGWSWSAVDAVQMCGETQNLDNVNRDNNSNDNKNGHDVFYIVSTSWGSVQSSGFLDFFVGQYLRWHAPHIFGSPRPFLIFLLPLVPK